MGKRFASAAARAFENELEELVPRDEQSELGEPESFGRRSLLLGAADTAWAHQLRLLDRDQVQQLLQVTSRQAISEHIKRDRLLAVGTSRGRYGFPAFQFQPDGKPYPAIRSIIRLFREAELTTHSVAAWFTTQQPLLEDTTPAEWLRRKGDEKTLLEAARRTATRLAH